LSGDTNRGGLDLGTRRAPATFGSQTVSYAGLHYYSLWDASGRPGPGAIPDGVLPGDAPMASDDTQGTINHAATGGDMNVLFVDTHVERRTRTELDPERAVGQTGGLLQQLRN
jgi:prepilin-type processing-associated H-X9-DG protein